MPTEPSRRTAERLRDAVESLFPQIERANPGEVPKRWRLPGGTLGALVGVSADELADLNTSISVLRRENMDAQALSLERILSKMQALMKRAAKARVEPDLEALIEAEGLATRPGPRPTIDLNILGRLRQAIITRRKVRLHYTYRGSGKRGYQVVQPYGFLYGKRHYLVAWSEVDRAKDFRSFALSNVERVELLAQTFTRKRGFSIQKYAERSFGVFQEEPVDVVWKFSTKAAPDAAEFLFHPDRVLEPQSDGSLVVHFAPGGSSRCLGTCSPGERRSRSSSQDGWRRSWASIAGPSCGGKSAAESECQASFVGYMKVNHVKRTSRRTATIATQKARSNLSRNIAIGSANERSFA